MDIIGRKSLLIVMIVFISVAPGCVRVTEATKSIWGSSTKALEEARGQALVKTYQCQTKECFDKILDVAKESKMEVFIADRKKQLVVLMHIKGSINTTEVGIFLSESGVDQTKIEVTSLSQNAKEAAANIVFAELKKTFKEI